jgi:nitrogen fixation NifU-like protein
MDSDFDELEQQVMAEMRRVYSEKVIDHAMSPRNVGSMPDADGFAAVTGPCGDTMEIWLKVSNGRISNATFWTDGCGTTIAAGSMVTELAKGQSVAEAQRITQKHILDVLGGLPDESVHCALLAANTLRGAIRDYLAGRNEPWKRAYRNR